MSARAVIATRCDHGPNDTRATPSFCSSESASEPGTGDDADLPLADPLDEPLDGGCIELAWDEHAGGAGVEERPSALDRVGDDLGPIAVAGHQERVGAGVQDERNSLGLARPRDGVDGGDRLVEGSHGVLDVGPDDPELDRPADRGLDVAVAGFEVGRHGQVDRRGDASHHHQHLVDGDPLAVRIPEGGGDRVARRGDRPAAWQ